MSKVYFSSHLQNYACWPELEAALQDLQIDYDFLNGTNDIWVRDFMPLVSPEGRYITYTYAPDYLRETPQFITDGAKLMPYSPLVPHELDLVLDGGNVIWQGQQVILTDKIFKENNDVEMSDVFRRLHRALGNCHLTVVPWDKNEPFGHIDGMLRFVDDHTAYLPLDEDAQKAGPDSEILLNYVEMLLRET